MAITWQRQVQSISPMAGNCCVDLHILHKQTHKKHSRSFTMGARGIMYGGEFIKQTDLHLPRKNAHAFNTLNNLMHLSID